MKTTYWILISFALTIFSQKTNGQINTQEGKIDSIEYYATVLTGKWIFIGYEKNNQLIETKTHTRLNSIDGFKTNRILTDSGYYTSYFIYDSLISTKKEDEIDILRLIFKKTGHGDYETYSEFLSDLTNFSMESCQPYPEIIYKDSSYCINLTWMLGEENVKFKISNDTLTLSYEYGIEKYKRKL